MKITMSSYGRFLGLFLKYYCPHIFSGDICVAKKLDREMVEDYSLVITATDGGNKVCNDIQNTPFSVSFFSFLSTSQWGGSTYSTCRRFS